MAGVVVPRRVWILGVGTPDGDKIVTLFYQMVTSVYVEVTNILNDFGNKYIGRRIDP